VSHPWDNDIVMFEEPKGVYCPPNNTYAATQGQIIISQPSGSWFRTGGGTTMTVADIRTHLTNLEPRYCNFLLNCPPAADGVLDPAMVDTLRKVGTSWSPDVSRPPLPAQPHAIEHPVTPAGAEVSGGTAWNAIDGYNDVFNATSVGQSLWSGGSPPQSITIDLGAVYADLDILGYLPRQDYAGGKRNTSGNITSYVISVSDDKISFREVARGSWDADSSYKTAEWTPPASGRYVRLEAAASNGAAGVVVSELSLGGSLRKPETTRIDVARPPSAAASTVTGASISFRGTQIRVVFPDAPPRAVPVRMCMYTPSGARVAVMEGRLEGAHRCCLLRLPRAGLPAGVYVSAILAGECIPAAEVPSGGRYSGATTMQPVRIR
jgi:alpha-L-fucosidase